MIVRATPTQNDAAVAAFTPLDPRETALLLDFDGTLVDIAPTPDAVHVPDNLRDTLARLLASTGGALALVSGRTIEDLDDKLAPLVLPIVGGHGAEMRVRDGEIVSAVPPLPEPLRRRLARAADFDRGILIEDKGYSLALHYRNAPDAEERLRAYVRSTCAAFAGEPLQVLAGKALFEVKRPGVSKGESVRALLLHAPFAGRKPVFIGDDVTDETVFAVLPALGGIGFSVQRKFDPLAGIFDSPEAVREALARLAQASESRGAQA
ncbi:MAG TPA: trehalose-phosphatase [Pseudolabrys sp.]|nr:trehalose-phosphatase [Pseudolabrys sp.]